MGTRQAAVTTTTRSLLPLAVEAVDQAAGVIRNTRPGAVTTKGDRDMASEVDYQVEREMREFLATRAPSIGFLGEEQGRTGTSAVFWTLDPVDGTANFVRGIPLCAVSLALIQDGRTALGVVALPFLGATYTAERGLGAFEGTHRLQSSRTTDIREAIVAIGDYAVGDNAERKNRLRLAVTQQLAEHAQRVRMLGSAATDLVWVADGKLDASITLANKPWDTAAGVLIAREAGAAVVDLDGTPHTLGSRATIATTAPLLDQVLALVRTTAE
jgi:myo-inositol-1(or 4)-monophosphatase